MSKRYTEAKNSADDGPNSIEADEIVIRSTNVADTQNWFKYRYMMQFLIFYAMFLVYAMRVNLSVTIIAMVNHTAIRTNTSDNGTFDSCPHDNGTEPAKPRDGPYVWPEDVQGWILNAFFWGYICTQIPGGYLAESFSVKWVFGWGIFLTAVLTILSQGAVAIGYYAFIALRILEGVCEGVTYPALYALCARWAPATERSWMAGIANVGTIIGTVVAVPVSAQLCSSSLGWPSVFYLFGGLGVIWGILWYFLATSTPEKCRWMSDEEKRYIVHSRGVASFEDKVRRRVPWEKLLTSRAVWVISFAKFTNSFIFYIFLTEIPNYLNYIFHFSIENNGWINSAAYMGSAVVGIFSSWASDRLIARRPDKITLIRKVFECTAQFLGAVTIAAIPFCGCDYQMIVVLLIVNATVNGFTGGGDIAVPIDIGPSQAGAIQGFANTVSNVAGILAPLMVGYLTKGNETFARWNTVFGITAGVSLAGTVVFGALGSAEVEEWAKDEETQSLTDDD